MHISEMLIPSKVLVVVLVTDFKIFVESNTVEFVDEFCALHTNYYHAFDFFQ